MHELRDLVRTPHIRGHIIAVNTADSDITSAVYIQRWCGGCVFVCELHGYQSAFLRTKSLQTTTFSAVAASVSQVPKYGFIKGIVNIIRGQRTLNTNITLKVTVAHHMERRVRGRRIDTHHLLSSATRGVPWGTVKYKLSADSVLS